MNYTIKLIQFNFDKTYDDARLFVNKNDQINYFNSVDGIQIENVNFIANDLINVTISFLSTDSTSLKKLLNYNYCIVTNQETNELMFFWINSAQQSSGGLIIINAEIDEFQTYIFDINFSRSLIERAHLDRFEAVDGTTSYQFKGDAFSELFEREPIQNVSKRLTERRRLKLKCDTYSSLETDFDNYVINKSKGWVYIFLSEGDYQIFTATPDTNPQKAIHLNNISYKKNDLIQEGGTVVLCYPLSSNFIFKSGIYEINVNSQGLKAFQNLNSDLSARIYAIKYSIMPPFENANYNGVTTIVDDVAQLTPYDDNIVMGFSNLYILRTEAMNSSGSSAGLIQLRYQDLTPKTAFLDSNIITNKFNVNIIKNNSNLPLYNPKLLSEDYCELVLSIYGNTYKYDLQKMNNAKPNFLYFEALTPDITKSLLVYDAQDVNGVYIPKTKNNYSGLLSTIDNSLLFSSTQLEQYLANNKNAFLSFQTNQVFSVAKGVLGAGLSAASTKELGGPTNPLLSVLGAGGALIKTGVDLTQSAIQFNLTIDNMRSAPNQLINANGNAIFLNAIDDIGAYIEIYQILPNEQKVVNDFMHQFGFSFNKIDKPDKYFNSRVAFNYIKCTITNIDGQVSNDIKERIKQIFEKGVRLWHQNTVNFTVQNYERSIE